MKKQKSLLLIILATAILISLLPGCGSDNASGKTDKVADGADELKVFFLDVGKGDAALIGIPGGFWAMIDTGPEEGVSEIGRQIELNGVHDLSAIFITHGHFDHIGGLKKVLSKVACDALYTNHETIKNKQEDMQAAEDDGAKVKEMKTGDTVKIGEASFTAIGPLKNYSDENDSSLVLMLQYKDIKMLFTADQLFSAEKDLLSLGRALYADVLKVAHHGMADSSSADFIKAVGARYAVISTDSENEPARQVLGAISDAGGEAFILGETGTLQFESDGETVTDILSNGL